MAHIRVRTYFVTLADTGKIAGRLLVSRINSVDPLLELDKELEELTGIDPDADLEIPFRYQYSKLVHLP